MAGKAGTRQTDAVVMAVEAAMEAAMEPATATVIATLDAMTAIRETTATEDTDPDLVTDATETNAPDLEKERGIVLATIATPEGRPGEMGMDGRTETTGGVETMIAEMTSRPDGETRRMKLVVSCNPAVRTIPGRKLT